MMVRTFLQLFLIIFLIQCGGKNSEEIIPSEAKQDPVKVTFFSGDVKILTNSLERKPELGMELTGDDQIVTGPTGNLEVLVRNSGLVKISKLSSVQVSSFHVDGDSSDTNIHINYGKVVTIVKKEKKDENYNVVTPTLVAGVRGTTFMTSVENPNTSKGIACGKDDCVVRVKVLEGSVSVRNLDKEEGVILEKNTEITVPGKKTIQKDWIKPLGKDSLTELKDLIVFHESNIGGYENLVEELKKGSRELSELNSAGNFEDTKEALIKSSANRASDEIRRKAELKDESKFLQKDISKEKLKLDPKETF